jgi:subtilisin family serine protease
MAIEARDHEQAAEMAPRLRELPGVEEAYVEAGPVPPPVQPDDDPRSGNQGYLDAAPDGIDARWAWDQTDGSGIGFVDMERGWTLNHEDLSGANITVISGVNTDYQGHGTAVLGEVVAVDNATGGIGIAPKATARVVSQWRTATSYSTPAAILSAAQSMNAGDVLLLEAQTKVNGVLMPVEVETATFDAIRSAVDDGIVVVEAGANGGADLDAYRDGQNRAVLDRGSNDFNDSGAIMVGAASSSAPHERLSFSSYGSRIDCFGWGEGIDTTGDGWQGNTTTAYTTGFGGTSGATPIVAGAAVLLQSWRKHRENTVYDPDTMRSMLSSSALNTASNDPATDEIGVMPNLRKIIERQIDNERFHPRVEQYAQFVYILFGLINDAPGVVWIPGKGPVPVDPGWGSIADSLTPAKRDLLAALAVNELAERMEDGAARKELGAAAGSAMRAAVEKIAATTDGRSA